MEESLSHLRIGAEGEKAAVEYLRARGYMIVGRNWRSGHHELDIIAITPDQCYHFVEVKTRREGALVSPADSQLIIYSIIPLQGVMPCNGFIINPDE